MSAHPVFALSDRFVDDYAALWPIRATYEGVPGHDHEWGDLGPSGVQARQDMLVRYRRELAALPPATEADDVLAARVLTELVEQHLEVFEHDDHLRDVGHMASTVPDMRDVLDVQSIATAEAQEALIERLRGMPDALAQWRSLLELALDKGVTVAARQVHSVIDQLRHAPGPEGAFTRRAHMVVTAAPQLRDAADAALTGVQQACEATAAFLVQRYLPQGDDTDGVGLERYLRAARHVLGTSLDPHEAYAWGWEHLAGLLDRAEAVAARIDPDANLRAVVQRLKTAPQFAAPSTTAFVELMRRRQREALAALADTHFDVPDQIRDVEVRLAPPGTPLGALYMAPSEDFTRPGSIWWALGERETVPLFEEVSTAYHEGFPGHHLQIGIQRAIGDRLSRAHRLLVWNVAYGEGWALYAETLMDELGYFEEPHYELGYLTSSILRALRVVIDLGLHLDLPIPDHSPVDPGGRWSYGLAVETLEQLTGLDRAYAESEITRYLGWPAQAIGYALGQRAIMELREQRRLRDGSDFNLAAFHADVLGSGPVRLDHLRSLVLGESTGRDAGI